MRIKKMKNKRGFIIYLENEIHFLKNIDMKIYRDYIQFKSLYSDRDYQFKKSDILSIQIYFKNDRKTEIKS